MPVAKIAAKVMAGVSLAEQGITEDPVPSHVSVKESVFPFVKFPGVDIVLGPEMKCTGEVMGISQRFSIAFAKSQLAAGTVLPTRGEYLCQRGRSRQTSRLVDLARQLAAMGYDLLAHPGTADAIEAAGLPCHAAQENPGGHPNLIDFLKTTRSPW